MKRFLPYIGQVGNWCFYAGGALAASAIFFMTVLITVDVIGREFGHSTGIAHEVSGYCLVGIVFLGLAYTLRAGKHIEIHLFTARLPERTRRNLKIATSVIAIAFAVWLLWFTSQHVIESYNLGSVSMTSLRAPLWLVQILIPIGLGLLTVAIMAEIIKIITPNQE